MDTFKRRIEVVFPKEIGAGDLWDLLEPTWEKMVKAFSKGRGRVVVVEATGRSADSRSFRRDSVPELRTAFEFNHVQPQSVDVYAHARGADTGVDFLKIWAWYGIGRPSFQIAVSGPSRMDVEKFSHELMKGVSSSKSIRAVGAGTDIVLQDLVVSSRDDGNQKAAGSHESVKALASPKQTEGPIARVFLFIREHTVGFVLSVVASIVAAVILSYMHIGT